MEITIINIGGTEKQFAEIIERLNIVTVQNDQLSAKLSEVEASNTALVSTTNAIYAALQAAASGGGLTADEAAALVARLDALKQADDATVAADTLPPTTP